MRRARTSIGFTRSGSRRDRASRTSLDQPADSSVSDQLRPRKRLLQSRRGVDHASGRVVLLVRVFEEDTRRSCLALAISSDGHRIDEILDRPAVAREAPYEEWGVEDARVTYLADEGRYAITYTGYSPAGPRVCLITTDDLLAPATYQRHGPRLAGENKNCVIFPRKVGGQYVILHRPMPRIVCIRVDSLEAEWPAHGVDAHGSSAGDLAQLARRCGSAADLDAPRVAVGLSRRDNNRGRQRVLAWGGASSTRENPETVLYVSDAPALAPEAPYEIRRRSTAPGRYGQLQNRRSRRVPAGLDRA